MEYRKINIVDIDYQDNLFSIRSLKPSIRQWDASDLAGNPIWLQEKTGDRFRIIDGFRRLALASRNSVPVAVPVFVFPENRNLFELWQQRIQKKASQQDLSIMALLESLVTLLEFTGKAAPPQAIAVNLKEFGIASKQLELAALTELITAVKQHCRFTDQDRLSYTEMADLAKRKEKDLQALSDLFKGLQLKGNKLSSMLQLIDELGKGYDLSVQKLLTDGGIEKILFDTPLHLRYKAIKTRLSQLRWPVLGRQQERWQELVARLKFQRGIAITVDPQFESDSINFLLTVSSPDELKSRLSLLSNAAELDEFVELFDFI